MQLARIIGSVVATRKLASLEGVKLLAMQPIDSSGKDEGSPLVGVDTVGAGVGEIVFYAKSKEGAMTLTNPTACADAGVVGILDYYYSVKREEDS